MSENGSQGRARSRTVELRHRSQAISSLWIAVPGTIVMGYFCLRTPWPWKLATLPWLLMFLIGVAGDLLVIVSTSRRLRDLD